MPTNGARSLQKLNNRTKLVRISRIFGDFNPFFMLFFGMTIAWLLSGDDK